MFVVLFPYSSHINVGLDYQASIPEYDCGKYKEVIEGESCLCLATQCQHRGRHEDEGAFAPPIPVRGSAPHT